MNSWLFKAFALDTIVAGFSIDNARAGAEWSELAYDAADHPDISIISSETGAACIVVELENAFVIAFRGSRSIQDFICDADFPRVASSYGAIHRGFDRDIESLMPRIWSKSVDVYSVTYKKPIFIFGHSLGGALAILCARQMAQREVPIHAVYTYGQPRVGDEGFAASYNAHLHDVTFRVVNQCDIVPRVPGLLCGFRNVGQKYFLPSMATVLPFHPVIVNPKLWLLLLSDAFGLWNDWANKKQLALLEDHFIASYITELARAQ